jgi:arginase family enzyme
VWDNNPLADLGVVDLGDVDVVLGDILETYRRIESAIGYVLDVGATSVTFGGDGAVTLPQLRAVSRRYPDLALVHFDAHTDTYPDEERQGEDSNFTEYNPASTFTRAAQGGLLDLAHSMHLGARGPISVSGVFEFTRAQGYELIDGMDLSARGISSTMAHVRERLEGRPAYVCWDMDFFDPSCVPGVFTPTWGRLSAREGLAMFVGLNIVATDVNTLSPLYDVGGMTAFLAAQCVMECIHLVDCARASPGAVDA